MVAFNGNALMIKPVLQSGSSSVFKSRYPVQQPLTIAPTSTKPKKVRSRKLEDADIPVAESEMLALMAAEGPAVARWITQAKKRLTLLQ